MTDLSPAARALIKAPNPAWVTTIRPDGTPHSTVVWIDYDGVDVCFNTLVGVAKERHLRLNPAVSIGVIDPDDMQRWVSVSGTAVLSTDHALNHMDRLSMKYLGVTPYPYLEEGHQRVIVTVTDALVLEQV